MSNLRLINETSATSVASVSVTDVFTSDFDIYKVVIPTFYSSGADAIGLRLINSSGSIVTASNYDKATSVLRSYNVFQEDRVTNLTYFFQMGDNNGNASGIGDTIYFFNPYSSSSYTFLLQQESSVISLGFKSYKGIGVLKQTASMTGFQCYSNASQTINDITIRTYGLRVDNG